MVQISATSIKKFCLKLLNYAGNFICKRSFYFGML